MTGFKGNKRLTDYYDGIEKGARSKFFKDYVTLMFVSLILSFVGIFGLVAFFYIISKISHTNS